MRVFVGNLQGEQSDRVDNIPKIIWSKVTFECARYDYVVLHRKQYYLNGLDRIFKIANAPERENITGKCTIPYVYMCIFIKKCYLSVRHVVRSSVRLSIRLFFRPLRRWCIRLSIRLSPMAHYAICLYLCLGYRVYVSRLNVLW